MKTLQEQTEETERILIGDMLPFKTDRAEASAAGFQTLSSPIPDFSVTSVFSC
jgi:hypothetical protein